MDLSGHGRYTPFTEAWYFHAFDRPDSSGCRAGEVTPEYSVLPDDGVDYVYRLLGPIRVIYIIRDPVNRAVSHLKMIMRRRKLDPSCKKDWTKALAEPALESRGDYARAIPRWRRIVGEQNFLPIAFKRLANEPSSVMSEIERFLHVSAFTGYSGLDRAYHVGERPQVPDFARQELEERVAWQREAIAAELGEKFVKMC
jgi:hypothetical protein